VARLAGLDGQWLTVESSTREDHPEGVRVYSLEVEDAHTYFVAAAGRPVGARYPASRPPCNRMRLAAARRRLYSLAHVQLH
jgi:hypothetical protein